MLHFFLVFLLDINPKSAIKTSASGVLVLYFSHVPMPMYFTIRILLLFSICCDLGKNVMTVVFHFPIVAFQLL